MKTKNMKMINIIEAIIDTILGGGILLGIFIGGILFLYLGISMLSIGQNYIIMFFSLLSGLILLSIPTKFIVNMIKESKEKKQ